VIDDRSVLAPSADTHHTPGGLRVGDQDLTLNAMAIAIWEAFDGRRDLGEVTADLARRHATTPEIITTEVGRLAVALAGHGALRAVSGTTRPQPEVTVGVDQFGWALVRWSRGGPMPRVPDVHGAGWASLVHHLRREHLVGLLLSLVAASDQSLDEQRTATLWATHLGLALASQQLEARLAEVCSLLEGAGIDHRVLKGLAHARLDYPRWDHRPTGDVDLLVPRAELTRAAGLVLEAGGHRLRPERGPGHDRRFAKAVTVVLDDPRVEVDLHATLVAGPFGIWIQPDHLFEHHRTLTVHGHDLRALGLADAFVHACFTAYIAAWSVRPMALLDLLRLADQAPDPDRVWELCRRWRCSTVVTGACGLARDRLPGEHAVLAPWLRSPGPTTTTERLVTRAEAVPRSYVTRELLSIALQPTPADKIAYARSVINPSGGRSWWRRARRAAEDWKHRRTTTDGRAGTGA